MSKIYTRTGDGGETALFQGGRVRKDNRRVEAYGTIDELNAVIGNARTELGRLAECADVDQLLAQIQHQLFDLGAELATPGLDQNTGTRRLATDDVIELERAIDRYTGALPPLRQFILPGGCKAAALLHLARCVCRRAERLVVTLSSGEAVRPELLAYMNRLSDLLFVLARQTNSLLDVADVAWQPHANR